MSAEVQAISPACIAGRPCPISGAVCPGSCVFADVLRSANLGILLLDTLRHEVTFENEEARSLLAPLAEGLDFDGLAKLLLVPPSNVEAWTFLHPPPPLRIGTRQIGYTIYRQERFIWFLLRDITDKLRLEAVAEAVEQMNNIGFIFASVRHELGNPINSLKMVLSVLKQNLDRFTSDTIHEYIETSLREVARIEDLLAALKSFTMYEDLRIESLDLTDFLERFIGFLSRSFENRGIAFETELGRDGNTLFDPRALHQTLMNLMTNAVDALAGRESPRIVIRSFSQERVMAIEIEDNGCGFKPEQMTHLFMPFFTSKAGGTGLGMVIAKKMLTRMNGTIELESRESKGTIVRMTLPRSNTP